MQNKYFKLLAVALISIFSINYSAQALTIASDTELYTDNLPEVIKKELVKSSISISYTINFAGQFECEVDGDCDLKPGGSENKRDRISAEGVLYYLADGGHILALEGKSTELGLVQYQTRTDGFGLGNKESKIVTSKGPVYFSAGMNLDLNSFNAGFYQKSYHNHSFTRSFVRAYSSKQGFASDFWGGVTNVRINSFSRIQNSPIR
jgi:hypothetical protein